jgi:hypothetical protein
VTPVATPRRYWPAARRRLVHVDPRWRLRARARGRDPRRPPRLDGGFTPGSIALYKAAQALAALRWSRLRGTRGRQGTCRARVPQADHRQPEHRIAGTPARPSSLEVAESVPFRAFGAGYELGSRNRGASFRPACPSRKGPQFLAALGLFTILASWAWSASPSARTLGVAPRRRPAVARFETLELSVLVENRSRLSAASLRRVRRPRVPRGFRPRTAVGARPPTPRIGFSLRTRSRGEARRLLRRPDPDILRRPPRAFPVREGNRRAVLGADLAGARPFSI